MHTKIVQFIPTLWKDLPLTESRGLGIMCRLVNSLKIKRFLKSQIRETERKSNLTAPYQIYLKRGDQVSLFSFVRKIKHWMLITIQYGKVHIINVTKNPGFAFDFY